jgi:hypothetical protein
MLCLERAAILRKSRHLGDFKPVLYVLTFSEIFSKSCMNPDTFFYDSVLRFSVQKNQAFPPIITGAVLPGIVADFGS